MRLIVILLLLLLIAGGVVLGALNADLVGYDLAFARVQVPKGAALLVVLALGWILGGLTAWLGVTTRHHRERRRAQKAAGAAKASKVP
jgi:lipopolysaccharide assembly protein A